MSRIVSAFDTNVLVYAFNAGAAENSTARRLLEVHAPNPDMVISELVLVEFYILLRNPTVFAHPLDAAVAGALVQSLRRHPRWRLVDHEPGVMDEVWAAASKPSFSRRRIFDVRLAAGLRRHGVTQLFTRNVDDFTGLGIPQVVDPFAGI